VTTIPTIAAVVLIEPATILGLGWTTTLVATVAVALPSSTVSVTTNVPVRAKACVTLWPDAEAPSPKLQEKVSGRPSGSLAPCEVNVNSAPTSAVVGPSMTPAKGGLVGRIVIALVAVAFARPSSTVSVIEKVPGVT
jgi:hypothetical protein